MLPNTWYRKAACLVASYSYAAAPITSNPLQCPLTGLSRGTPSTRFSFHSLLNPSVSKTFVPKLARNNFSPLHPYLTNQKTNLSIRPHHLQPSNAKPSHINIIVIENGPESQPEKRSLQATDSASSYRNLVKDFWLLIRITLLKLFRIVTYLVGPLDLDAQFFVLDIVDDQPISVILKKLIFSQDFHRLVITLAITLYIRTLQWHVGYQSEFQKCEWNES